MKNQPSKYVEQDMETILSCLDSLTWKPMKSALRDGTIIFVWHKLWKVPMTVKYVGGGIKGEATSEIFYWISPTLTTMWPEESFSAWTYVPSLLVPPTFH